MHLMYSMSMIQKGRERVREKETIWVLMKNKRNENRSSFIQIEERLHGVGWTKICLDEFYGDDQYLYKDCA